MAGSGLNHSLDVLLSNELVGRGEYAALSCLRKPHFDHKAGERRTSYQNKRVAHGSESVFQWSLKSETDTQLRTDLSARFHRISLLGSQISETRGLTCILNNMAEQHHLFLLNTEHVVLRSVYKARRSLVPKT